MAPLSGVSAAIAREDTRDYTSVRGYRIYSLLATICGARLVTSSWALTFWICDACSFKVAVKICISPCYCANVDFSCAMIASCFDALDFSCAIVASCSWILPCSLRNSLSNIAFTAS